METLILNREWHLGSELTAGGFGRIHDAKSDTGEDVVIKLIPKMPGGERELLFVNLSGTPNVLPILDTGEWGDFWAVVMPKAKKSLRQHLVDQGGALSLDETVETLLDITTALAALQNDVVHCDLKPENVLFYDGHWHLADFGIARYAEETTATETWKHAKTWVYAAPEQWRGERATSATDIYAYIRNWHHGVWAINRETAFRWTRGARLPRTTSPWGSPSYLGIPGSIDRSHRGMLV